MIIVNEFGGVTKLGGQQPGSLIISALIFRPMDQVQELTVVLSVIYLRVQGFQISYSISKTLRSCAALYSVSQSVTVAQCYR